MKVGDLGGVTVMGTSMETRNMTEIITPLIGCTFLNHPLNNYYMTPAKSKNQIIHEVKESDLPHFAEKADGEEVLTLTISGCHECMDEYAEQTSVGFAEWIANNNIQRSEITKGVWDWMILKKPTPGVLTTFPEYDHCTTAELYSIYLKTKEQ